LGLRSRNPLHLFHLHRNKDATRRAHLSTVPHG
jgi:hypothetical protein